MARANLRRQKEFNSIAVIGNSLPRQCGIATFTTDLVNALAKEAPYATCSTVAITDTPEGCGELTRSTTASVRSRISNSKGSPQTKS